MAIASPIWLPVGRASYAALSVGIGFNEKRASIPVGVSFNVSRMPGMTTATPVFVKGRRMALSATKKAYLTGGDNRYLKALATSNRGGMTPPSVSKTEIIGSRDVSAEFVTDHRRDVDKSETLMEPPYGLVDSTMSSPAMTVTEDETLDKVLTHFELYTGLPVVDSSGKCVGIISNIDVAKYARSRADSLPTTKVGDVMSTPAYVIQSHAPVAYAAGLMLKHKIHRLPVVDKSGVVVGIVTRTDLYEPLIPPVNPVLHQLAGHKRPMPQDY